MKKFLLYTLHLTLLTLIIGCATVPKPEYPLPPPPDRARLKWLYDLRTDADLYPARRLPFFVRISRFLLGEYGPETALVQPFAVCALQGRVYVSDTSLKMVVLFDSPSRTIKYIGKGSFVSPAGVALDSAGRLYVADSVACAIKVYDQEGNFLYQFGERGFEPGKLSGPLGIAIDQKRQLIYIVDMGRNPEIEVFDLHGNFVLQFAGSIGTEGKLLWPQYIAIDQEQRVYVNDNLMRQVIVYDSQGKYLRTIGEAGDLPGYFARPKGIAVDSDNNIYVADCEFGVVQIFNPEGYLLFLWSGVPPLRFSFPTGLYVDEKDRVYVVDTLNRRIQVYQYLK